MGLWVTGDIGGCDFRGGFALFRWRYQGIAVSQPRLRGFALFVGGSFALPTGTSALVSLAGQDARATD